MSEVTAEMRLAEALSSVVEHMADAGIHFMLLGETARSIKQDDYLSGDYVHVSVLKRRFGKEAIDRFLTVYPSNPHRQEFHDVVEDEHSLKFTYKGAPIRVQIIHGDYDFFNFPDVVFYGKIEDGLKIPNPLKEYLQVADQVK